MVSRLHLFAVNLLSLCRLIGCAGSSLAHAGSRATKQYESVYRNGLVKVVISPAEICLQSSHCDSPHKEDSSSHSTKLSKSPSVRLIRRSDSLKLAVGQCVLLDQFGIVIVTELNQVGNEGVIVAHRCLEPAYKLSISIGIECYRLKELFPVNIVNLTAREELFAYIRSPRLCPLFSHLHNPMGVPSPSSLVAKEVIKVGSGDDSKFQFFTVLNDHVPGEPIQLEAITDSQIATQIALKSLVPIVVLTAVGSMVPGFLRSSLVMAMKLFLLLVLGFDDLPNTVLSVVLIMSLLYQFL